MDGVYLLVMVLTFLQLGENMTSQFYEGLLLACGTN